MPLRPEEVLQRTMDANQHLASARFTSTIVVHGSQGGWTGSGRLILSDGISQEHGQKLQFSLTASGLLKDSAANHSVDVKADVVMPAPGETLVQFNAVSFVPSDPRFSFPDSWHGKWWLMNDGSTKLTSSVSVPNPAAFASQVSAYVVSKDHGIERHDGVDVYNYDIALDPVKATQFLQSLSSSSAGLSDEMALLSHAKGMVWIDAQSFFVRRLQWNVASKNGSLQVDIAVTDHNTAPPVVMPTTIEQIPLRLSLPPSDGGQWLVPQAEIFIPF